MGIIGRRLVSDFSLEVSMKSREDPDRRAGNQPCGKMKIFDLSKLYSAHASAEN
jgi:hypothetical protein